VLALALASGEPRGRDGAFFRPRPPLRSEDRGYGHLTRPSLLCLAPRYLPLTLPLPVAVSLATCSTVLSSFPTLLSSLSSTIPDPKRRQRAPDFNPQSRLHPEITSQQPHPALNTSSTFVSKQCGRLAASTPYAIESLLFA
jgi:hypothetical protein